jgi:hypothetical protein
MASSEPHYPTLPFSASLMFYGPNKKKAIEIKVRAPTLQKLKAEIASTVDYVKAQHHLTLKEGT